MLNSSVNNQNIEKVELLPDDIMMYVSRDWCNCALRHLKEYEYYGDLLDRLDYLLSSKNVDESSNRSISRHILMSVRDIKKLLSLCGGETFYCIFPYNYDEISNKFLEDNLGITKVNIEILIDEYKIEDIFKLIDALDDDYLKKISFIYMKYLYNRKTEEIIENIYTAKRRVLGLINDKLY